jgi:hypothetical protein
MGTLARAVAGKVLPVPLRQKGVQRGGNVSPRRLCMHRVWCDLGVPYHGFKENSAASLVASISQAVALGRTRKGMREARRIPCQALACGRCWEIDRRYMAEDYARRGNALACAASDFPAACGLDCFAATWEESPFTGDRPTKFGSAEVGQSVCCQ